MNNDFHYPCGRLMSRTRSGESGCPGGSQDCVNRRETWWRWRETRERRRRTVHRRNHEVHSLCTRLSRSRVCCHSDFQSRLPALYKTKQELSCCWDGRAMLHNSNSEKMGVGHFFLEKNRREARVPGHESYWRN